MYRVLLGTAMALSITGTALAEPGGNARGNDCGPSQSRADQGKPDRSANIAPRAQSVRAPQPEQAVRGNAARNDNRAEKNVRRVGRDGAALPDRGQNGPRAQHRQTDLVERAGVRETRADYRPGRTMARNLGAGLVDGCPPGLAKKNNGCLPPGLARPNGARPYDDPRYFGYESAGRFLLGDGYLYRLDDGNRVTGFIPLLAGALGIGNIWPEQYARQPLPDYYRDYFNVGPAAGHAYADNVIYRVDPQTAAIQSVAAILTGDRFAAGQPMPAGYGVYNIPAPYQSQYADTQDAAYRYADGRIYQIDPQTQLIQAVIELLT